MFFYMGRVHEKPPTVRGSPTIEFKLSQAEQTARFFYHGTSKQYLLEQLDKYGRYQHNPIKGGQPDGLFIGLNFDVSKRCAIDRSQRYGNLEPIVLKIKAELIRPRIHKHQTVNDIVVDFLDLNEFDTILVGQPKI